jgi:hypothetical protein
MRPLLCTQLGMSSRFVQIRADESANAGEDPLETKFDDDRSVIAAADLALHDR